LIKEKLVQEIAFISEVQYKSKKSTMAIAQTLNTANSDTIS